ncbi:hypothetical protein Tco_1284884 [Tanacetum coccineum]
MNCYQPPLAALAVQDLQRVLAVPVVLPVPCSVISSGLLSASLKILAVSCDQQHGNSLNSWTSDQYVAGSVTYLPRARSLASIDRLQASRDNLASVSI